MNAAVAVCADLSALDEPEALAGFTRWRADGAAESSLRLGGLHCAACAGLIEAALDAVPGVRVAQVNAAAGVAHVEWNPALTKVSALVAAVRAAGYDAAPDLAADARALRQRERRLALWRLFVAAFCAMQVMMFATPIYLAEPGEMAPDQQRLLHWGSWLLTLPVLLFSAAPFFSGAWRALRQRRIGMDLPVALGIGVTFVASSGAAFDPGGVFGSEVYFDSLAMFVAFLLGARWLELCARQRAAAALEAGAAALPVLATRVLADGRVEQVPAQRLVAGDVARVALGAALRPVVIGAVGCSAGQHADRRCGGDGQLCAGLVARLGALGRGLAAGAGEPARTALGSAPGGGDARIGLGLGARARLVAEGLGLLLRLTLNSAVERHQQVLAFVVHELSMCALAPAM